MTHYLIYKITNNINGKIYIGKHKTDDLNDGYMGSGKAIKQAIPKYGVENFTKEILYDVDDPELMDFLEELIVDEEFVARRDTYNMALGGWGGAHSQTEETRKKISETEKGRIPWNNGKHHSEETRRKMSEARKGFHWTDEAKKKMSESRKGRQSYMKGKHHSEETKQKISQSCKGTHWYNNGEVEFFGRECPEGFTKGRIYNKRKEINYVLG